MTLDDAMDEIARRDELIAALRTVNDEQRERINRNIGEAAALKIIRMNANAEAAKRAAEGPSRDFAATGSERQPLRDLAWWVAFAIGCLAILVGIKGLIFG